MFAVALVLSACAGVRQGPAPALPQARIAVLPFANFSATAAPLRELQGQLEDALRVRGVQLIADADVEAFLARKRLRYTGGIARDAARQAGEELGATAVLITAVTAYQASVPPRMALASRLVTAGKDPAILWADESGRAGDEAPGFFDLGIVNDPKKLEAQVIAPLASSLAARIAGKGPGTPVCGGGFGPQSSYRSRQFDPRAKASIAVLPFVNETARRNAGDVLALHFVSQLEALGNFEVMEPGVVRDLLLQFRIATDEGVSLDTARVVTELVKADYVLTGYVRDYVEPATSAGTPVLQFSAILLDRKDNEVAWEVTSAHQGDEGLHLFDLGRVATAQALGCRMAAGAVETMLRPANQAGSVQKLR